RPDVPRSRHLSILLRAAPAHAGHRDREVVTDIDEEVDMDRIDRRGFLECMAWTGTGVLWAASGGVLSSRMISPASAAESAAGSFSFVQIRDTHVGFKGEANKDAAATLPPGVGRIN